ncbi:hypothetical protein F4778DRAFT_720418 [Xylariomycetidae sp. FL2044]|nr:hypothetical protein F4778DRAFT_720418 [Xylariomycetidae sp. FL2044]
MADTDSDPELAGSSSSPVPPSLSSGGYGRTEPHHWHTRHELAASRVSPPVSPSVSMHSLGMSPLSPLRQQFSNPFLRSFSSPQSDPGLVEQDDMTQDSRDVLVQRLHDLAAKLTHESYIGQENVNSLHAKVSEMELVINHPDRQANQTKPKSRAPGLIVEAYGGSHDSSYDSPTFDHSASGQPDTTRSMQELAGRVQNPVESQAPQMSPEQVRHVVAEAQSLCRGLEVVVSNLRSRQEETDHIHDMLMMRAERAAQRIIYLEGRLEELESEKRQGEMEFLNLRIQLKAIEVQCLNYLPENADQDLRESISAWKTEWSTLKRKRARKNGGTNDHLPSFDTPTREMRSPD